MWCRCSPTRELDCSQGPGQGGTAAGRGSLGDQTSRIPDSFDHSCPSLSARSKNLEQRLLDPHATRAGFSFNHFFCPKCMITELPCVSGSLLSLNFEFLLVAIHETDSWRPCSSGLPVERLGDQTQLTGDTSGSILAECGVDAKPVQKVDTASVRRGILGVRTWSYPVWQRKISSVARINNHMLLTHLATVNKDSSSPICRPGLGQ